MRHCELALKASFPNQPTTCGKCENWLALKASWLLSEMISSPLSVRALSKLAGQHGQIESDPGGCFTNNSWAFQNILSKFGCCRNRISCENFKLKFCTCAPKHGFGHMYKVLAWNSHKKCDFWHFIFSRDYFGELAKLYWNKRPVAKRGECDVTIHSIDHVTYCYGQQWSLSCNQCLPWEQTVWVLRGFLWILRGLPVWR